MFIRTTIRASRKRELRLIICSLYGQDWRRIVRWASVWTIQSTLTSPNPLILFLYFSINSDRTAFHLLFLPRCYVPSIIPFGLLSFLYPGFPQRYRKWSFSKVLMIYNYFLSLIPLLNKATFNQTSALVSVVRSEYVRQYEQMLYVVITCPPYLLITLMVNL